MDRNTSFCTVRSSTLVISGSSTVYFIDGCILLRSSSSTSLLLFCGKSDVPSSINRKNILIILSHSVVLGDDHKNAKNFSTAEDSRTNLFVNILHIADERIDEKLSICFM